MKRNLMKFVVAIAICLAVHVSACLISSVIVNHFISNTRLANFSMYDGYADSSILLVYISIAALLLFDKIKGNALVITTASFVVFVVAKVFIFDLIADYLRFYVKTKQNGSYSFEVFKHQIGRQWDSLLWEFSNIGQFLSTIVWLFIALLSICYLSLWAKNKLKLELKVSPIFGLFLLLGLSSCGDNIKREKDKHPEIPEFPHFANDALAYKKLDVAKVSFENYKTAKVDGHNLVIHTQDYFFYAMTDSSLFLITGYREALNPGIEYPAKNFVTLTRLRKKKIEKLVWTDTCDNDLPIFNDGKTLIIGSRVFDTQAQRLTFSKIAKIDDDSVNKSIMVYTWNFNNKSFSSDYKMYDSTFVKEFDRITTGSDGHLSGGLNNGINYTYDAVPMVYYEFNFDGKVGKTKINFDEQKPPLLLKVADKIYCITYSRELKLKLNVYNYEIGVIE